MYNFDLIGEIVGSTCGWVLLHRYRKSSGRFPSQEAYCVSKTKSLNKKILLSSVLCSFKFSIITVLILCSLCNYWFGVFFAIFIMFVGFLCCVA